MYDFFDCAQEKGKKKKKIKRKGNAKGIKILLHDCKRVF